MRRASNTFNDHAKEIFMDQYWEALIKLEVLFEREHGAQNRWPGHFFLEMQLSDGCACERQGDL